MGLEKYKDESNDSNGSFGRNYSDGEVINQLKKFKDENGFITKRALQCDSSYLDPSTAATHFGSWNGALEAASIDVNEEWEKYSEWVIYYDMLKAAEEYGIDFTRRQIDSNSELINSNYIKKTTGKTFNEVKEILGLEVNSARHKSDEDVIEELRNIEGKVTKRKVSSHCSFSGTLVANRFGDGSFTQALKNIGLSTTSYQNLLSKSKRGDEVTDAFDFDTDADGYVYILKSELEDMDDAYYVGETSSSLNRRLERYVFHEPPVDSEIFYESNKFIPTSVYRIINVNCETENLKDRLREKERKESYNLAIEEETVNIYGGK